jgi:hypothetical protein
LRTLIGQTIDFTTQGNAQEFLLYGWSVQEATHIWTLGTESALWITAPTSPHGYFLEISWRPYTSPPDLDAQPVTVWVNGARVFSGDIRHEGVVAYRCPTPPEGTRRVVITFAMPDATQPATFGRSTDTRALALCFSRLRLLPVAERPPRHERRTSAARLGSTDLAGLVAEARSLTGQDIADLMGRFEMICGNCDMGLAQRAFGLEPLSLLRFAGTYPSVSVKGLDSHFQGLGERMAPWESGGEWMIHDDFGINYHTGKPVADVPRERLPEMERIRIGFLRRKLLEDLQEARKVFVADRVSPTLAGVLPVFLALNRRGPARRLLWIVTAPDATRTGEVEEVMPGLFMGRMFPFGGPMGEHVAVRPFLDVMVNTWLLIDPPAREAAASGDAG